MLVVKIDGRCFGWVYEAGAWLDLESTDPKVGVERYSFVVHGHSGKDLPYVDTFDRLQAHLRAAPVIRYDDLIPDNRNLQLFLLREQRAAAKAERAARAA